jgi:hypothetical protein
VCPELYDRTIVCNGVSKAYSMTGWRIGYLAGPETLVNAMKNIQSQSTSNPTSIAQVAATVALEGDQSYIKMSTREFKKRHDYLHEELNKIKGVRCPASQGTFYIFPNMEGVIEQLDGINDDLQLAPGRIPFGKSPDCSGTGIRLWRPGVYPHFICHQYGRSERRHETAQGKLEAGLIVRLETAVDRIRLGQYHTRP